MTACQVIKSDLQQANDSAVHEANAWRGRCIDLYARAEDQLARELLRQAPEQPLPMLVSDKAKRMRAMSETKDKLVERIDEFANMLNERTLLTHGCAKVWIDREGQWLLQLTYVSRRGTDRSSFTKNDAAAFAKQLHATVQRLEAALRH